MRGQEFLAGFCCYHGDPKVWKCNAWPLERGRPGVRQEDSPLWGVVIGSGTKKMWRGLVKIDYRIVFILCRVQFGVHRW
jgi:hypothetical protein